MTHAPYKSVAGALLFCVFLGPLGLLYASFWGGVIMICLGIFVLCGKLLFLTLMVWLMSCIWAVSAVESHNRKLQQLLQK